MLGQCARREPADEAWVNRSVSVDKVVSHSLCASGLSLRLAGEPMSTSPRVRSG
jgi:hypothetical protein